MRTGEKTSAVQFRLIKETAKRFAEEYLKPHALDARTRGAPPRVVCRAYGELGLGLAILPRSLGGLGLGYTMKSHIAQWLAASDAALAFCMPQPGAFAELMMLLGEISQQRAWLDSFSKAPDKTWGAVAIVSRNKPTLLATEHHNTWVLNGTVGNVYHLGLADRLLVIAQSPKQGPQAFVLPLPYAGVSFRATLDSQGLQSSHRGDLQFNNVHLPEAQRLTGYLHTPHAQKMHMLLDLFNARQSLQNTNYAIITALSAARYALNFAEKRRTAGNPIEHYNVLGFLLADMHLACESAAEQLIGVSKRLSGTIDDLAILPDLHQVRAQTNVVALSVVDSAENILNDLGHTSGHWVEIWRQDIQALVQLQLVPEPSTQSLRTYAQASAPAV